MDNEASLRGKLLIAMPNIGDPRFERSVIYMCSHDAEGAMGLVVNRPAHGVDFPGLLEQLGIEPGEATRRAPVRFGGPVETSRGFVLHSAEFSVEDSTEEIDEAISLTATVEVLRAMAEGRGPDRALVALGYAGWGPSQIESEMQRNGWLIVDADPDLVFAPSDDAKWTAALSKLGVSPSALSAVGGSA